MSKFSTLKVEDCSLKNLKCKKKKNEFPKLEHRQNGFVVRKTLSLNRVR
jgi:hypothetical protein